MRQFYPTSLKVKDFGWAKEIKFLAIPLISDGLVVGSLDFCKV
jgi:hypothetical protein